VSSQVLCQTPRVMPEHADLGGEAKRGISEDAGLQTKVVKVLFQPEHRTREVQLLQDDHNNGAAQRFLQDVLHSSGVFRLPPGRNGVCTKQGRTFHSAAAPMP
jgi:hypothetical protein